MPTTRPSSAFDDSEFDDPRFDDPRYESRDAFGIDDVPPTDEQRLMALASHLGAFVGLPILAPLAVWFFTRDRGGFASDHAREALNFQITVMLALVASGILTIVLIGLPLLVAVGLGSVVLTVVAAARAGSGQRYRYPFTLRLV
jgi:uncharacterized Tic20 family protein